MEEQELKDALDIEGNKARIKTNIAYLLIDVAESFMLDAESVLNRQGFEIKHEEKRKWNMMLDATRKARAAMRHSISRMYHFDETDKACDESDRMQDLIWLITDRCGDNDELYSLLHAMIYNSFKSELNYYEA